MPNLKSRRLKKTQYAYNKVPLEDAVFFDAENGEENYWTSLTDEEKDSLIYSGEEFTYEEQPEREEVPLSEKDSFMTNEEEELGEDLGDYDPKQQKKLKKKQKAVEKLRRQTDKKMRKLSKKDFEKTKKGSFSLFEESQETEEEVRRRKLYERINADGYYNVIHPIDYEEKLEKSRLGMSKTKLFVALALLGSVALIVFGLLYILN